MTPVQADCPTAQFTEKGECPLPVRARHRQAERTLGQDVLLDL